MMKKGDGYLEHVLSKSKTFGNPFPKDVWGPRNDRAVVGEWPEYSWKMPDPVKKSRKSSMYD